MDIAEYEKESPVLSREEAKLKGLEREGIGRVRKRRTQLKRRLIASWRPDIGESQAQSGSGPNQK